MPSLSRTLTSAAQGAPDKETKMTTATATHKTAEITNDFEGRKVIVCTCGRETTDMMDQMTHSGWTLEAGEWVRA